MTTRLEKQNATVKAAIYARFSSDMQSPQSANDQIFRIKHYVHRGNVPLIKYPLSNYKIEILDKWIVKDEAETGRVATRDGYQRILEGIRNKSFQVLFVDDLSRLTRSLGNQITLYEMLKFFFISHMHTLIIFE